MKAKNIDPTSIIKLVQDNFSTVEISKLLEISPSTVTYWKKKLGLDLIENKINWKLIQEYHEKGLSYREIANKFNISVGAIEKAKRRGDFVFIERPKLTKEEKRARKREAYARWRSRLIKQTPQDEDRQALRNFYKNCPVGYEVDHIIPLSRGGLHSLSNLQYLTISENRSKKDKLNWKKN